MTLIKVKKRFVAPLLQLGLLAMKYVYDRKNMKRSAIDLMKHSVVHWSNKIGITDEELYDLQKIAKFLKCGEEGGWEERKELFSKHSINWMKFHRMPHLRELGGTIT